MKKTKRVTKKAWAIIGRWSESIYMAASMDPVDPYPMAIYNDKYCAEKLKDQTTKVIEVTLSYSAQR